MINVRLTNTIFLFINLFLCLLAPSKYSYFFCLSVFSVFILQNIIYFKNNEYRNLATFEFFFVFSFTLCNFIYPIVYFPVEPDFRTYNLWYNKDVISYSTALAGLSYSSYIMGLSLFKNVKVSAVSNIHSRIFVNDSFIKIIYYLSIICYVLYILSGGLSHLKDVYSGEGGDLNEVGLYSYFSNIYSITILLLSMFLFRIKNKMLRLRVLTYLLISILLILLTGSRTIVIGVISILIVNYSFYIKNISRSLLLIGMGIGSLVMNFVMLVRENDASDSYEKISNFDVFLDLIGTNRNLYVLVDFADNNFNAYFVSALNDLASPIPTMSRYISELGFPPEIMGGAWTTFLEFGSGSKFGLGTNIVGEMYFAFGIYGVIFISLFLGLIIRKAKNNLDNIYYYVIYFLFVSHAIFYPRAFYLFQPRIIVWSLLIIYIFQKIYGKIFNKKLIVS